MPKLGFQARSCGVLVFANASCKLDNHSCAPEAKSVFSERPETSKWHTCQVQSARISLIHHHKRTFRGNNDSYDVNQITPAERDREWNAHSVTGRKVTSVLAVFAESWSSEFSEFLLFCFYLKNHQVLCNNFLKPLSVPNKQIKLLGSPRAEPRTHRNTVATLRLALDSSPG